MKCSVSVSLGALVGFVLASTLSGCASMRDPLPSWNSGPSKKAIIEFVDRTTSATSADYVAEEDRVAVFDNDGTLWSEQPMYFQLAFALDRVRELAPQHPEWTATEPFASVLKGDIKGALAGGDKAILEIVAATHAGITTDEFEAVVTRWMATAEHPTKHEHYNHLIYQPMVEVLRYLRENGYKTYIVSGGGIGFMRPWTEKAYGIPPEQVVGSSSKSKFEMHGDEPVLMKQPEIWSIDDGPGKPENINLHIGRQPVIAFGNSDGDLQMLQWTARRGPSLCLLVHHTDAEREWAYDRQSHFGKLDKAWDIAIQRGWTVIDMKKEWKRIYP